MNISHKKLEEFGQEVIYLNIELEDKVEFSTELGSKNMGAGIKDFAKKYLLNINVNGNAIVVLIIDGIVFGVNTYSDLTK